ncbi:four helix bundle protein [Flavobacterium croceum DSM 17960]|jgi:four helix bundle protein|uniref:Four helix bundle protein n=1 Tax=Flavobacterium croceum DSM 17960 TaxID=1121886 RepID=A0A2S4N664_9FLAO|nr:four helix bundle protein [Flavobacterium croceum]POS01202.1 four helix bundle protein [Flavobacterium croceum DSM 17960]
MSEIKSYKDLLIWEKGIEIVALTYKIVSSFPKDELYALSSQIKRSSISIPSNIAEGYGRQSTQNYIQFIKIARGSLCELETQLLVAKKLDFIQDEKLFSELINQITEESKMINSFLNKLEKSKE